MNDRGISLIRWRDPLTDPPTIDHDQSVLLTDRSGRVWTSLAGHVIEGDETPFAWAEWPNIEEAVSLEDIETVLAGAMAYAVTTLDGDRKGERMEAAVARIRAALGGDEQ